jgi:ribonuclease HI
LTLKDEFPRLFSISLQQNATINEMGAWEGGNWNWNLSWRRFLFQWELEQLEELMSKLKEVIPSVCTMDKIWWKHNKSGEYSTRSFTQAWWNLKDTNHDLRHVWKGLAPPRAELLVWFILQEKMNTRSRLKRLNILKEDATVVCPFCELEEESVSHLLMHCLFSWKTWMKVLEWWHIILPMSNSPSQWFHAWMGAVNCGFQKKLWMSLFLDVCWTLWHQRNLIVFEKKKTDWEHLFYLIKLRLGYWMKGWSSQLPFAAADVIHNLEVVRQWRQNSEDRRIAIWHPPPTQVWKWNVDGSARGKPGPAGIGGILCDNNGVVLAQFASSVGIRDSNEAEFLAIAFALEMCLDRTDCLDMDLIVESDSKNALAWVNNASLCPWGLRFVHNKLKNILMVLKKVLFIHICRESNQEADALAKRGSLLQGRELAWFV